MVWFLPLLIGIGVGVAATVYFWDDIQKWLADFLPKVAEVIRKIGQKIGGKFEHVAMVVAEKLDEYAASIKHKLYFKAEDGTWTERITERRGLAENQLPPEVQAELRRKRGEANITPYIEQTIGSVG